VVVSSDRELYDALVVVHVACALVGFGSVAISGVYGFTTRRPAGPESVAEARRYFSSPGRLEWLVAVVPVPGVAALAVQPGGRGVGQLWALLALLIWAGAAALLLGVVRPAEARLRAALGAVPADAVGSGSATADPAELAAGGHRLGWASVGSDLAFFVALLLMIFQPH
jgi:uncharacterized membrane protein